MINREKHVFCALYFIICALMVRYQYFIVSYLHILTTSASRRDLDLINIKLSK